MKLDKFGVIGHPVGHSMSPFIHKRLFALSGLAPKYGVYDIERLETSREFLLDFDGVNVTIPHKSNIIALLDEIDPLAARFGSVNTLKIENGKIKGFTTDGVGCMKAIRGANTNRGVLVLGSGGAARAIVFALLDEKTPPAITLAMRSREKGQALQRDCGEIRVLTLGELADDKQEYGLLINATSVGMFPNVGALPVSGAVVERCDAVFDAVYNPHETELLKLGAVLGKKVIYGMDMLVLQAVAAHELWYNAVFTRADVQRLCVDAAEETGKLFLKKD